MSNTNSRIIKAKETDFLISDSGYYLDGRLMAIVDGSQYDFMGREIFTTGFFRENIGFGIISINIEINTCLLYTSPSPRDRQKSRMPSSA